MWLATLGFIRACCLVSFCSVQCFKYQTASKDPKVFLLLLVLPASIWMILHHTMSTSESIDLCSEMQKWHRRPSSPEGFFSAEGHGADDHDVIMTWMQRPKRHPKLLLVLRTDEAGQVKTQGGPERKFKRFIVDICRWRYSWSNLYFGVLSSKSSHLADWAGHFSLTLIFLKRHLSQKSAHWVFLAWQLAASFSCTRCGVELESFQVNN